MPRQTEFPDDDRRAARMMVPEIVAAEQRILTSADALMTWMTQINWGPEEPALERFFMHTSSTNPGARRMDFLTHEGGVTKAWILERIDPDANRFFMELLRSAWELRCWKARYGLTVSPHEPFDGKDGPRG